MGRASHDAICRAHFMGRSLLDSLAAVSGLVVVTDVNVSIVT
jgi:hypothetical protein